MKNYYVKFLREFDAEVQADNVQYAQVLARRVIAQFPEGSCRLVSIIAEDYVDPVKKLEPGVQLTQEAQTILDRNTGLASNVHSYIDEEPKQA